MSDIEAGRRTTAESTTDLIGALPSERDVNFNGNVIFRVGPQRGRLGPNQNLDGIHALGTNGAISPSSGPGGVGVVGFGAPYQGTGVLGLGGASGGSSGGAGSGGIGVHGIGGRGAMRGFGGPISPGVGVFGQGGGPEFPEERMPGGAGVVGAAGPDADGVVGTADAQNRSGVYGFNAQRDGTAYGVFGRCHSPSGAGVGGHSELGAGIGGFSEANDGVVGTSNAPYKSGVYGFNSQREQAAFGVFGRCNAYEGAAIAGENSSGYGASLRGNGAYFGRIGRP